MDKPLIQVVLGPTCSGKTSLAISLAGQFHGAVISADSRQVYAGMNIGTAKPPEAFSAHAHDVLSPVSVQDVPHYLFNVASPVDPLSLADWQTMAQQVLAGLTEQGKQVILAGGTMLYIDSVVHNYTIPHVPPNGELRAELESRGAPALYLELMKLDPAAGKFIEPHNTRRIIRALEVIKATGQAFSLLREKRESPYDFELLGLFPGWEALRSNITKRTHDMFTSGLIDEVRALRDKFGDISLLETMVYRQGLQVLGGELDTAQAIVEAVRDQMRYARRQMSWWKGRREITWVQKPKY